MRFLDYITNIETLNDTLIEGDGNCFFRIRVEGFGIPGDGAAQIEFPYVQAEGDGKQLIYGSIEFPAFEILAQNANSGDAEFLFEIQGFLGETILGNVQFPISQVESEGRSGNTGEYYFYMQVEGEGNANREYELCD